MKLESSRRQLLEADQLTFFGLETGTSVTAVGVRGVFTVVAQESDGSIQVYGGARSQFRSFPASVLRPVKRPKQRDRKPKVHPSGPSSSVPLLPASATVADADFDQLSIDFKP